MSCHNMPSCLIDPDAIAAKGDGRYGSLFLAAVRPILKEHEAACRGAPKGFCGNCGQPSAGVLQTPMSWLHHAEDPLLAVFIHPVC